MFSLLQIRVKWSHTEWRVNSHGREVGLMASYFLSSISPLFSKAYYLLLFPIQISTHLWILLIENKIGRMEMKP